MIEITQQMLDQLDQGFRHGGRIPVREPAVVGVVRRSLSEEFVSLVLKVEGENYRLSAGALEQLCRMTNTPVTLLRELPDDVCRELVNAQLRRRWSWFTHALVSEDEIRWFIRPAWRDVDLWPSQVVQVCARALAEGDERPLLYELPDFRAPATVIFRLTHQKLCHVFDTSPRPDDRHRFSIQITVDFTGTTPPTLAAFSYRQVCSNGMVAPFIWRHSRRDVFAGTTEQILKALEFASREVMGFIRTTLIPGIEESIRKPFTLPANLPRPVASLIRSSYETEDLGGTLYHFVNALSRAARLEKCPQDWRDRLMRAAGEITVGGRCPSCLQRVPGSGAAERWAGDSVIGA
ncbi:MAG TPA: hypothetical protein VNJ11_07330 [Bryobacteraceae bacterium]|nr:hypothetical protein [Bryobacteraceae bacterium]